MGVRLMMPLQSFMIFMFISFGCGAVFGIFGYCKFKKYYKRKH